MDAERYAFRVEWIDAQASLKRIYQLFYFDKADGSNEIELIDLKNRRTFLKKCPYPSISLKDIFVGAKLTIYARQMTVASFDDEFTRSRLERKQAKCFGMITPSGLGDVGKVIGALNRSGLRIHNLKLVDLAAEEAKALFGSPRAGRVIGMEIVGEDALSAWKGVIDTVQRTVGGRGYDGLYAPGSEADSNNLTAAFFGPDKMASARKSTATLMPGVTCCLIKPHAVAAGIAGPILDDIASAGLEVSALEMFDVDLTTAEEFLEVYKGVVEDYKPSTEELAAGRFLALELRGEGALARLREVCGPRDVEVAKHIRPKTIRGRYGVDTVRNAVHCTDLEEDGTLECEYFFSILQ